MNNKPKLLISACLMGENVRYDGKNNLIEELVKLSQKYELISFCPEVASGMVIPRVPNEIQSFNPLVVKNEFGIDTTDFFIDGAKQTLHICKQHNIQIALLKSKSPSCGNLEIYDGNFNGTLVKGQGLTANILEQHNIKIYNENQIGELI
ncbi:MAG: DUF523 domain-containing protein [Arcobacteraceae bacterium]|nr:DUF523 domain-containing protein [Arcobacteraceae bacterium]